MLVARQGTKGLTGSGAEQACPSGRAASAHRSMGWAKLISKTEKRNWAQSRLRTSNNPVWTAGGRISTSLTKLVPGSVFSSSWRRTAMMNARRPALLAESADARGACQQGNAVTGRWRCGHAQAGARVSGTSARPEVVNAIVAGIFAELNAATKLGTHATGGDVEPRAKLSIRHTADHFFAHLLTSAIGATRLVCTSACMVSTST